MKFVGLKIGLLVVSVALAGALYGGAAWYNCKTYAVEHSVAATPYSLTLVREWNENGGTYDEATKSWTGEWLDGGTTVAANQLGGCWLSVTLEKGKDYVIGVTELSGCVLMGIDKVVPTYTKLQQITYQGMSYLYVRAADWSPFDTTQTVSFYIHYQGAAGTVGQAFNYVFRQCSIDDIIPAVPGTIKCPLPLDVTADGETTIAASTERQYGRLSTAYKASLKAGERYTFTVTHPEMGAFFSTNWGAIPGEFENDVAKGRLVVTVTADYEMVLLVLPDDAHWETGNVGGGTLSWHLGDDPQPKQVFAGTYTGTLHDEDTLTQTAQFAVVVEWFDNGTTNFSARVVYGDLTVDYIQNANGELQGETTVGGKTYKSFFEVSMTDDKTVRVDGSVTLDDDGAAEFYFAGILGGEPITWEESFLRHDATKESAFQMGITAGAFSTEPAGSETLIKVHRWGSLCNVTVSDAKKASFTASGDPTTTVAKAYLLDCAVDEKKISDAAALFVITSFDLESGVIVFGGVGAGGDYGNGHVDIRTSLTPGGVYDKTEKSGSNALFYRAYLVK